MRGYVLIRVRAGKEQDLRDALRDVPGILRVDVTLGPFDMIAEVEAQDSNAIGRLVTETIRPAPAVVETVSCLVLDPPH